MKDILTIKKAEYEDINNIEALVNNAYRGDFSKQGWTTEADLLDGLRTDVTMLKDLIEKENSTILVGKNNCNEIITCVNLQIQNQQVYLGMLTVSPKIQNKGLGKKVLEASENFAVQNNCSLIKISVITVRAELIAWYERRGFIRTGKTHPFPADIRFGIPKQELTFIEMVKHLNIS